MSFSSDGRGLDDAGAPRAGEQRKLKLRPLARLAPYVVALSRPCARGACRAGRAALATLVVPVAVRRMIDFGFSDKAVR